MEPLHFQTQGPVLCTWAGTLVDDEGKPGHGYRIPVLARLQHGQLSSCLLRSAFPHAMTLKQENNQQVETDKARQDATQLFYEFVLLARLPRTASQA